MGRVLRACSLLEASGRERLDADEVVIDESGVALIDNGGRPPTTAQLRGKLHVLVSDTIGPVVSSSRVFLSSSSPSLWAEVGLWADIRNLVAHEGQWLPPPFGSTLGGAQRRSAAALKTAGLSDGYDSGAIRYCDAVMAATEAVLRAVASGAGDPESSVPPS